MQGAESQFKVCFTNNPRHKMTEITIVMAKFLTVALVAAAFLTAVFLYIYRDRWE